MRTRFYGILTFILFVLIPVYSQNDSDPGIKVREVQVKQVLSIADLKPRPSSEILEFNNLFGMDHQSNYYFVDRKNHRVLKFNPAGKLLCQIGSIGQEPPDLFFPGAIYIDKDALYAADKEGRTIKKFSLSGKFISAFEIKDCVRVNTLWVNNGMIYLDARYWADGYTKRKLITIVDNNGKYIKRVGKIIKTNTNWFAHKAFNAAIFQVKNHHVYGAFKSYPIIFQIDQDGRNVFFQDLGKMNIPEIDELNEKVIQMELDTPQEKKTERENVVHSITYCSGFAVDDNGNLYYSTQRTGSNPRILHLDKNGKILEKFKLMNGEHVVRTAGIYIKKSLKYGLGYIGKTDRGILFTF
jgi:hypothetical protein